MYRSIVCAAVAAAAITMAIPAQAMPADAGLNSTAPANVQQAQYSHRYWRNHRHVRSHRRGLNSYAFSPYGHRHCWTVRVHTWGNHWRLVTRCN